MKVLLFGASGAIGQAIAAELTNRGHETTAVARSGSPTSSQPVQAGDVTDPDTVTTLAPGHDAVVSAVSASDPASLADAASSLVRGLRETEVRRLLVVGGAGTLETEPGVRLMDTTGFPDQFKHTAFAQAAALAVLRTVKDIDWTYLSPAVVIKPGERTGRYRTSGDTLLTDTDGKSVITIPDFALALVDELEQGTALRRRMSVAY
ncbi:NAD(P)H-binding protein [Streptomyces sp. NPDC048002]|uniref:NAD(P)-dependent oxidoreductase n=1 Tax=Streptomyces sp. NPDC048002 TaxID=3154344 RepID=UPI0033DC4A90